MADSLVIQNNRTEPYWVSYIKGRIQKKKNFLGVITGQTGSGKSWSGLSICFQVDPTFTPERIVTSMKQLMELINSDKLKSGDAILWDEAGIDISNRNWQSLINKLVNFLLQTFRHKRLVLIMTVPYMDFLDANTRKLFHAEFLTQSIDYEAKKVKIKPQLIQYNPRNRKFYYKYLRVRTKKGVQALKVWNVDKPVEWLIDSYEELKHKFTANLNKDIHRQIIKQEQDERGIDNRKPLTQKQEEALKLVAQHGSVQEASKYATITERTLCFHIHQAKKKGYLPEEFAEKEGFKGIPNRDRGISFTTTPL